MDTLTQNVNTGRQLKQRAPIIKSPNNCKIISFQKYHKVHTILDLFQDQEKALEFNRALMALEAGAIIIYNQVFVLIKKGLKNLQQKEFVPSKALQSINSSFYNNFSPVIKQFKNKENALELNCALAVLEVDASVEYDRLYRLTLGAQAEMEVVLDFLGFQPTILS